MLKAYDIRYTFPYFMVLTFAMKVDFNEDFAI